MDTFPHPFGIDQKPQPREIDITSELYLKNLMKINMKILKTHFPPRSLCPHLEGFGNPESET